MPRPCGLTAAAEKPSPPAHQGRHPVLDGRELRRRDGACRGKRVVVQGLGNVDYHAAKFLAEEGAVLVGLAEYEGSISNPNGLDLEMVVAHRKATGSILGFPGAADQILRARGVYILPDFYRNAGGVTVSYFEWLKNLSHVRFGRMERRFEEQSNRGILDVIGRSSGKILGEEELSKIARGASEEELVNSGLEDSMIVAYHDIRAVQKGIGQGLDLRTAALVSSINKVAGSYTQLGVFP